MLYNWAWTSIHITVFFGSDNPYHALWIMAMAKLFIRPGRAAHR
jgi:hypothetical protein